MVARRLLANIVDIIIFVGLLVASFLFVLPFFASVFDAYAEDNIVLAGIMLALVLVANTLLQYPFLVVFQTIGKALFGLKIISTNDRRPLTVGIVVQRELFAKVMTMYLMCLPVLLGKIGQHEIATETKVVHT